MDVKSPRINKTKTIVKTHKSMEQQINMTQKKIQIKFNSTCLPNISLELQRRLGSSHLTCNYLLAHLIIRKLQQKFLQLKKIIENFKRTLSYWLFIQSKSKSFSKRLRFSMNFLCSSSINMFSCVRNWSSVFTLAHTHLG